MQVREDARPARPVGSRQSKSLSFGVLAPPLKLNSRSVKVRLFLTVWVVYALHATTNVVRETYLAIALGGHASVRVDEFLGLHPDLFEIPGRGSYINNNPGASMLGGVAYFFVRPAIALAVTLRPQIADPKPPAQYDDPRPNRTRFMNAARARGVDITLGLAAIGIQVLLMAPLGALGAVLVWGRLRQRIGDHREALFWALVYAFATPLFFRSAFLNQNAIIAFLTLTSYLLMTGEEGLRSGTGATSSDDDPVSDVNRRTRRRFFVGLLLGIGLLNDYSAVPFLVVFGLWILVEGFRLAGLKGAVRLGLAYGAGALGPILLLLAYQWIAFGSPWFPAQRYMPPTEYSVKGWFGFTMPTAELAWGNLFDSRYGLFAYSPLLLAALSAPFLCRREWWAGPGSSALVWSLASCAALYLFSCANQFANLQWNTGVRYMVPAAPLLFLAAVPVLRRSPVALRWLLVGSSLVISLAVTMTREDIPTALSLVATGGPTLPVIVVLDKMASGYSVLLPWWTIWAVYAITAGFLWLVWRNASIKADV
ncbi:MAG: hypothetical protein MNPFHGCM_02090 [Gemmatimonadaceae bacterium]|nr:hypothetical protein [Gemmatimonadaceae bacterium]